MSETEPIFPGGQCVDHGCNHGLTKLEYFTLKIFCASAYPVDFGTPENEWQIHKMGNAVKQARLLLSQIDKTEGYK